MPESTTLGRSLILAAVGHVALFLVAGHIPARRTSALRLDPLTVVSIDVSEPVPELPRPLPTPDPQGPSKEPLPPSPEAKLAPTSGRASPSSTSDTAPAASVVTAPEGVPPGDWSMPVAPGQARAGSGAALSQLALDGTNHFLGTRETAADEARAAAEQANRAAGQAMRDSLHDHDVALGLGGGGPVVSAVEAALRSSLAPNDSHAVFIATADASGAILRVEIESSTDDAAFHEVANELLTRLRGQKIKVPAGSHGLAMRIDVASQMALPSGGSAGFDLKSLGAHGDLSNIGAQPHRVIHARVLGEQML